MDNTKLFKMKWGRFQEALDTMTDKEKKCALCYAYGCFEEYRRQHK